MQCVPLYAKAGVTSVVFSRDGSHVLTASFDGTVRIHGRGLYELQCS
jgi:WD40 repeat protein